MDKKDFLGIMQELNVVYGDRKFPLTEQTLNVWNKYLGKCEKEVFEKAVEKFVRTSAFPPTIADIFQEISKISEDKMERRREFDAVYLRILNAYPASYLDDAYEVYVKNTGGDIGKAREMLKRVQNRVKAYEHMQNVDTYMPPLSKILEGQA